MDIEGAALATIISQLCSFISIICFFFPKKSLFHFKIKGFSFSFRRIFSILSLGFSPFIMAITECAIQIVFNVCLNQSTNGNKNYTAASTIMLSELQLISLPLNGIGYGMQPFVSYNYGKGDGKRLKEGIMKVTLFAFIFASIVYSVSMAFPIIYARLFSASEDVHAS